MWLKGEKREALRIGMEYLAAGNRPLARSWLKRSMPNAIGALRLAQLYAHSRSFRSSRAALGYLSIAVREADDLSVAERQELTILVADVVRRRFHGSKDHPWSIARYPRESL